MAVVPPIEARAGRCTRCWLQFAFCICADLPRVRVPLRVVVVRHWRERKKTSNTARLIELCLEPADIFDHVDHPFDPEPVTRAGSWLVFPEDTGGRLQPAEGAASRPATLPRALVLIDGTWGGRAACRIGCRARRPAAARAAAGAAVSDRLRRPHAPWAVSTVEAAALAMEALGLSSAGMPSTRPRRSSYAGSAPRPGWVRADGRSRADSPWSVGGLHRKAAVRRPLGRSGRLGAWASNNPVAARVPLICSGSAPRGASFPLAPTPPAMNLSLFERDITVATLASGSRGNCTYIGDGHAGVLIDCGVSTKQILRRMAEVGLEDAPVDAVLITHEHSDHVGAGTCATSSGADGALRALLDDRGHPSGSSRAACRTPWR